MMEWKAVTRAEYRSCGPGSIILRVNRYNHLSVTFLPGSFNQRQYSPRHHDAAACGGGDAGLHAGGDGGFGEGCSAASAGGAWGADYPRQHLPSLPAAWS